MECLICGEEHRARATIRGRAENRDQGYLDLEWRTLGWSGSRLAKWRCIISSMFQAEVSMKTFASLRKLWKQRPFEPFRIVLESGQHYDILGPEFIMVTKTALAFGRRKNKDDAEFDSAHVVG